MRPSTLRAIAAVALIAAPLAGEPAAADPVADFYKGRTFTILVGQEPGTGFDIYGRALARHIGRHIPGNPQIVVQNMPGASGVNAFNWLFNIAPKDGTVMATSQNVAVSRCSGTRPPSTMRHGSTGSATWRKARRCAACRRRPASRRSTTSRPRGGVRRHRPDRADRPVRPRAQGSIGTKLKIIYGYKGTASIKMAMASGEVKGICGLPMSTIKSFWKDDLDSGRFKPIIQLSGGACQNSARSRTSTTT